MTEAKKDTIYIDVEDDITSIINKVKSSSESITALVLPKRAVTLQSIVNMKLLKRSADNARKKIVLITSDPGILPLAGAAKVHVAANLQSQPKIPPIPEHLSKTRPDGDEVPIGPDTTVGEAMGDKADEEAEVDNTKPDSAAAPSKGAPPAAKKGKKPSKKLKVPNFKKFRKWIILGAVALALLVGFLIWAIFIAPKAVVTVRTETSDMPATVDFTTDTDADRIDLDGKILPAKKEEIKKTETEKVPTTGQKNKGNKASGSVSLKNCKFGSGKTNIPKGTALTSGDFTFITQKSVTLPVDTFSGGECQTPTKEVDVLAQKPGADYNLSARSYTVSGYSGVTATGSAMTGGTDNIVKVVAQVDIDNAKKQIEGRQEDVSGELKDKLEADGYVALTETISSGNPEITVSPQKDTEASEVSVTSTLTSTMLGVKEDDLKELIKKETEEDVAKNNQSILKFGFSDASFELGESPGDNQLKLTIQTTLVIGPDLKLDEIKQEIAGKKRMEAELILVDRPGFKESKIETRPFWVKNVPKNPGKIEIVIESPDGEQITE